MLTWCRYLGQSRRRLFSFCRLSAEHRTGWCRGSCSCWSRMIGCRPMTRPANTKCYHNEMLFVNNTFFLPNPLEDVPSSDRSTSAQCWSQHVQEQLGRSIREVQWMSDFTVTWKDDEEEGKLVALKSLMTLMKWFTCESEGNGWCSSTSSSSSSRSEQQTWKLTAKLHHTSSFKVCCEGKWSVELNVWSQKKLRCL